MANPREVGSNESRPERAQSLAGRTALVQVHVDERLVVDASHVLDAQVLVSRPQFRPACHAVAQFIASGVRLVGNQMHHGSDKCAEVRLGVKVAALAGHLDQSRQAAVQFGHLSALNQ